MTVSTIKAAPVRRSQQDRRESTRKAFLEATLQCLGRKGYAATSIGEIVKEAGLSRGALSHHYPTKLDLVAAAITYFYVERFARLSERLIEAGQDLTLEQRLHIFREDVDAWAPVGFEIMVAIRTDDELRREYMRRVEPRTAEMIATYERMFPEFGALESPELMIGVVGAFLRGLSIESSENPPGRADRLFGLFVSLVAKGV